MARHAFTFDVGDWSEDGHSGHTTYHATANKPIKEVREAYFKASEELPGIEPESFVCDYEDSEVPEEVISEAAAAGFEIDPENFGPDEMAKYVVWFLNIGDPDLDVTLVPRNDQPTLHFYGCDEKDRHIGAFGYGITGN